MGDRGTREHDSACHATQSLVDHLNLGSNDGQTFPASHAWLSREPGSSKYKPFAASDVPKPSVPWQKRRRTLCVPSCPETRTKGLKRPDLLTIEDYENQAPPQSAFDAFGPGRREANGASSFVSSSDEEGSRSCLAATRTCSGARTGQDGRNHTSGSQT